MAGPVLKSMTHRQNYCKAIITKILQFVVDQAVLAGKLAGLSKPDLAFEVLAPSLTPSDMSAMTTTMLKMSQSVKLAEDQRWVSHETAARVFLKLLTELGVQVSIDDELEKINNIVPTSVEGTPGSGVPGMPPGAVVAGQGPGAIVPREPTGSELQTPTQQLSQQILDRQTTGSTVTRKGNPL
jgi:hypothetical protein